MEDVHGQVRLLADRDRLLDAVDELVAVVAQVRRVHPAGRRGRLRERHQLVELRVRVGRVDEARRDAPRALPHRVADEAAHLRELGGGRRALLVVHDDLAHLAEAHVRQDVHRGALAAERREVAGEVGPVGADAGAARVGRRAGRRLARRDRSAFANHLGRDALPDLAFRVAVHEEREVGVRVRVDEAGRDDHARRRRSSASRRRPPGRRRRSCPPRTATDPLTDGPPLPSTMRALVMRRSKGAWAADVVTRGEAQPRAQARPRPPTNRLIRGF